jgi:hypothetical protein
MTTSKMKPKTSSAIILTVLLWQPTANCQQTATVDTFLSRAINVLPIEDRYAYHKSFLQGSIHLPARDPGESARADELSIADGYRIVSPRGGPLATYGTEDTIDFMRLAMDVKLGSVPAAASAAQQDRTAKVIIAGTKKQFEEVDYGISIGQELRQRKDYELRVDGKRVLVCGFDDAGVMHGLFNLQARMKLREAPFLPRDLQSVRHSRFQSRLVLSWLGWMQWPDKYLAHLAHDGYDAIYASVYANPNGVPGPPHYDLIREQDPERLRQLVQRAKRYGIRVYAPILHNNTGDDENKDQLREHVRDIVTKFPEIHGYILLTEGFYFKKFFGAGGHGSQDLNEWAAEWTDAVKIVAEECHKIDPTIEVLPWEYNIDFRPSRIEIKRHVVNLLPRDTIPLLTWENGKSFKLGEFSGYLRDYSISQVGPAEVAAAQIAAAKSRGMKVYCKSDCFATWQFGTTPYLPCPQQWQRRYDALADHKVDGTLETWSNGYKPNFIAELRYWSCWTDSPSTEELQESMARRLFGKGAEAAVIEAWQHFSEAIQMVPDTGPSMGTNNAVAHPLFLDEPPPRIMTLHNSWWDEAKKTPWRHRMIEAWPYCHRIMIFMPDFNNKINRAEQYARQRSGVGMIEPAERLRDADVLPVFNKYVLKAADEIERGLVAYREAATNSPKRKQLVAFKEVLVVEQMQRMLRSLHAILEFEDLRFRLAKTNDPAVGHKMLERMQQILREEIKRTEQSLETSRRDSRLGYECEMDYVYTPMVLAEKLDLLHETLEEQLPRYRARL